MVLSLSFSIQPVSFPTGFPSAALSAWYHHSSRCQLDEFAGPPDDSHSWYRRLQGRPYGEDTFVDSQEEDDLHRRFNSIRSRGLRRYVSGIHSAELGSVLGSAVLTLLKSSYRAYPGWVKVILIRKVEDIAAIGIEVKNEPERFEKAFKDVPRDVWHVFSDPAECNKIIQDTVSKS